MSFSIVKKTQWLMSFLWVLFPVISGVLSAGCSYQVHNIRPPALRNTGHGKIVVMTYNIRIGSGRVQYGRNPYELKDEITPDLTPVIAAIRSINPDILGLQEVLGTKQAAKIASSLQMNYAYIPHGIEKYGVWWGVALLSKFPIVNVTSQEISYGRGNTRSNLIADVRAFGRTITCINMHKDKDQNSGAGLYRTMNWIQNFDNPIILMGDLNIKPDDPRLTIFSGRFIDTARAVDTETARFARERGTFPGRKFTLYGKRIDYIFVERDQFDIHDAGLLQKEFWMASDHLGYFSVINMIK